MKSNLNIQSNLMIDDDEHKPITKYLPGDFLAEVYPGKTDRRVIQRELTYQQILEYEQYLICVRCGRTCAGTC